THFGAMNFLRTMKKDKIIAEMMPVPRVLSASCGVCVKFNADDIILEELTSVDLEGVYKIVENEYQLVKKFD
ncbi:MAG: DUF3343 domain-containing protein, partial [Oscillospiraceae bacterium]